MINGVRQIKWMEGFIMERKELVNALGEHFGVKPKYMGAPSFAYQIQAEDETYIIDRVGSIKNSKGNELTLESILKPEQVEPEIEAQVKDKREEQHIDGFEVAIPLGEHTAITLRNLVNMLSCKQKLIAKAFDLKEPILDENFAKDLAEKDTSNLGNLEISVQEVGAERCKGLVFDFEKANLTFKLLAEDLNQDKIAAFIDLFVHINKNALTLKHASFKPAQEENPKFAFRTWLTRLGMIGDEFKATRKTLLANLEGNGAFRKAGAKNE